MKNTILLFMLLILCNCKENNDYTSNSTEPEPPIVDGFNNEYETLQTLKFKISNNVTFQIYQDTHFVWLTYNCPEGSYGTMDMTLEAPNLNQPKNLHISAQLGEWPSNQPNLAPKTPESEKWGITNGWTGNAIWFKQLDTSGEQPQLKFKSAPARELQLSKAYFGKGTWKFNIEIRAMKDENGKFQELKFPKNDDKFELQVN